MEIRRWLCYVFISCFLVQYLAAKSVSLNELIAAETAKQSKPTAKHKESKVTGLNRKRVVFNENKTAETGEDQEPEESLIGLIKLKGLARRLSLSRLVAKAKLRKLLSGDPLTIKKPSLLKNKKAFEIKSPLKPKIFKRSKEPRRTNKLKKQAIKREISGNEKQKHIPFLKSLSKLFDNLIDDDTSEPFETNRKKYKRNQFYFEQLDDGPTRTASSRLTKSRSKKKTTTPSPSLSSELSTATKSFTLSENNDYSTHRPNKSIPILLSRNTSSARRNNNRSSKRSSASHNRDIKRNISGNHGDNERDTGSRGDKSDAESDEDPTHSIARNDTSSVRYTRTSGDGIFPGNPANRKTIESDASKEQSDDTLGKNKFEIRGNETESEISVRKPDRQLRGLQSKDKIIHDEGLVFKPLQSQEVYEEGSVSTANISAGDKRIIIKNGQFSTEDEEVCRRNETVIVIDKTSLNENPSKHAGKNCPVVMIFDGYSVTRDKNGHNTVSSKAIRIHS